MFVTHDIDEAVKLGDKVAVLRVGGKLAQFDEPGELLARPADDFVADFVGRDRGYRALGFRSSAALAARRAAPRSRSASRRPADAAAGCWSSTPSGRPQGWLDTAESDGATVAVGHEHLVPGGSLYDVGVRLAAQRARRGAVLAVRARASRSTSDGARRRARSAPTTCSRVLDDARRDDERGLQVGGPAMTWVLGNLSLDRRTWLLAAPRVRACRRSCSGSCSRSRWAGWPTATTVLRSTLLNVAGLLYTIPSLALFVLLPPLLGTGSSTRST